MYATPYGRFYWEILNFVYVSVSVTKVVSANWSIEVKNSNVLFRFVMHKNLNNSIVVEELPSSILI